MSATVGRRPDAGAGAMRRRGRPVLFVSIAVLAMASLFPLNGSAAEQDALPTAVRCESRDLRWVHCPLDSRRGVDLVRQISDTPCIRDTDWGVDERGVWVARGCRADFRARGAVQSDRATVTRRMIRCESRSGRVESCPVSLRGAPVRLLRQMSSFPCRAGESWGVERSGIWVSRGCKGEFEIGDREAGFPPGPRLLQCESKDRRKRTCGTTVEIGVRLHEQLSDTECVEGQSWGWSREGVWVDRGCRGRFAVE